MKPGLKNKLLRIDNLLLYISFCLLAGTGGLLAWRLVPGSEGGHGLSLWGLTRHDWGELHLYLGVLMALAALAHLLLNRAWLRKIAAKGRSLPLWGGLAVGMAAAAVFLLWPLEREPAPAPGARVEAAEGGSGLGHRNGPRDGSGKRQQAGRGGPGAHRGGQGLD